MMEREGLTMESGEYRILYVAEDYHYRIYRGNVLLSVWPRAAKDAAFEAFERLRRGQSD